MSHLGEAMRLEGLRKEKARAWAEVDRLRDLLHRCLKSVEGGKWRDSAGLSAEAHPVWDDVRETLR